MYGWLLESVQHFIVQECGEEVWETILRESGARNTVFSMQQQYPDTLMLRLASALTRIVTNDPNSPATSRPNSPCPKKLSFKIKPSWRSASVHTDNRIQLRCPFTATNALTAVTKNEINAYNSSEEIASHALSVDRINEGVEFQIRKKVAVNKDLNRRSLGFKLEDKKEENKKVEIPKTCLESTCNNQDVSPKDSAPTSPCSSNSESTKVNSILKNNTRKTSVNLAMDVYKRRGSGVATRPRFNSISLVSSDRLNTLKEKFSTPEKVMHFFGRCFVKFFSNYGYDTMIRATGRYFCTFLQSVDNIHQRMRFTFPRMRSPSMQLTRAHIHGAELVYSSTRTGFTHYLMGQLYEIAEDLFSLKLKMSIVKESMEGSYYVAVLRLEFDNSDYVQSLMLRKNLPCPLPAVPASLLLQLFPFGVLLDRKMKILSAGDKLVEAWGGPFNRIQKSPIGEILRLRKPKVSFTWDKVVCMQTMLFELELMRWRARTAGESRRGSQGARAILLKGPIYFLEQIDALIFLCSPIFNDLDELRQAGLYLADMNGHGLSKEMLLQGWQHLSRLELLFEKAETRSLSLEKSCRLRDQWKKRGDQLLYSMIPKPIAEHLRAGKDPMSACQAYDSVTIMFCGLQIAEAGTRADVMQTVAYMNDVYSRIDRLLDSHRVYKVETVGTVYMLVSGAPERRRAHAASAASAALAVSRALPVLTIGIHSGPCVAGVLGLKLPRFCLVGDTVNTASRMQTTSEPGKIHVSAQTAAELPSGKFRLRSRGPIKVKGKGMMETFWLEGEVEEDEQDEALQLFSALCGE
ncbi:soluble guanylate cyclase 89Db-like [Hyposmocoma kahamanoa]|uniref:soluble guanylate cyclase 89Db-like n=1 Tax=Hyposmocoma kahamanoa TaxID=1477025 RepID=UPI000E6D9DD4|nr:soluble guanylate cyclase 89Db-like [Hyposmocoma kahamanoa]